MTRKLDTGAIIALTAAIREQANMFILDALAERGVQDILPAHGSILNALFKQSPLQMRELAERTGRKKNTITGIITTLEERGYCRREPDPHDARVQLVFLTEKGEAMRAVQESVSGALLRKVWGDTEEDAREGCIRTLERILQNLTRD